MRIAIVEDDQTCTDLLVGFLDRYQKEKDVHLEVQCFSDGFSFLDTIQKTPADIVFMDIGMPNFSGLEAAHAFRRTDQRASLFFVTNMAKYAINGYEVNALDFLIKPVSYLNFTLKLEKALRIQKSMEKKKILLKSDKGMILLSFEDILYVESDGHYMCYHTRDGEYTVRETMQQAESVLLPQRFVRCHKAFIVNLAHVERVEGNSVIVGDKEVLLGRSKRKLFMNKLVAFYGGGYQ